MIGFPRKKRRRTAVRNAEARDGLTTASAGTNAKNVNMTGSAKAPILPNAPGANLQNGTSPYTSANANAAGINGYPVLKNLRDARGVKRKNGMMRRCS